MNQSNQHTSDAPSSNDIACVECGTANTGDRRYCGGCGGRLWQPCFDCSSKNPVSLQFCGNCGANLIERFNEVRTDLERRLESAKKAVADADYLQAQILLQAVFDHGDTRLESYSESAKTITERLETDRESRTVEVERLFQRAVELANLPDYLAAHSLLSKIPRGLRSPEIEKTANGIRERVNELTELKESVRTSLEHKSYDNLLPIVERLQQLQTHSSQLEQLANKLREKRTVSVANKARQTILDAKQLVKSKKYQEAGRLLAEIDESIITDDVRAAYQTYRETCWLAQQLTSSPHVTSTVASAWNRFQKLRPGDANIEAMGPQIQKRLKSRNKDHRTTFQPWCQPKAQSHVGHKCVWWNAFNIDVEGEGIGKKLRTFGGQLAVSFGLGLHGLGQAEIKTNLLSASKKKSFLSLGKPKSSSSDVWGIDIASSAVKAIRMSLTGGKITVVDCHVVPHAKAFSVCQNEHEQLEVAKNTLEKFVESADLEKGSAVVGLASGKTLGRFFDLPKLNAKKVHDAVAYEAKVQIPLELEQIEFDYHLWPAGEDSQQVALFAARKEHVKSVVDLFDSTPISVLAVQPTCIALHNAGRHQFSETDDDKSLAILDIGADGSILIVGSRKGIRFRNLTFGMERVNRSLVERLKTSRETAEQLRKKPESAKFMYVADAEMTPSFEEYANEIRRILSTFENSEDSIQKLVVTGGGSAQHGILRTFMFGS